MKYISINKWPLPNYQKLKMIWNKNSIVSLEVKKMPSYDDMISFLINEKDEFALAILSELAEKDNIQAESLEKYSLPATYPVKCRFVKIKTYRIH